MLDLTTCDTTHNAISSPGSESGPMHSEAHDGQMTGLSGGMADSVDCSEQRSESRPVVGINAESAGAMQTQHGDTSQTNGFWRDADWLYCRDGKWRPVEPGTFPLAHGSPARVVSVCPCCETRTTVDENLRNVRSLTSRNERCGTKEVLQSDVYGEELRSDSDNTSERALSSAVQVCGNGVQSMRGKTSPGTTPQERRRNGQYGRKHRDSMLDMPQSGAPSADSYAGMRRMWEKIRGSEVAEQDLFCPVCQRVGPHQLSKEMGGARVGRLRAYGNAIVAPVAEAFIRAYIGQ